MKLKTLRILSQVLISLINIWLLFIFVIIFAHFIEELTDGDQEPLFQHFDMLMTSSIILGILAAIISWFKPKTGAILTIIASLGLVYSDLDDLHLGKWPLYVLFLSGLMLLFYVMYTKKHVK